MSIKNKIIATVLSGLAVAGFVAATALSNPQAASAQTGVTPPAAKSAVAGERGGPRGRDQRPRHVPGAGPRHHRRGAPDRPHLRA